MEEAGGRAARPRKLSSIFYPPIPCVILILASMHTRVVLCIASTTRVQRHLAYYTTRVLLEYKYYDLVCCYEDLCIL